MMFLQFVVLFLGEDAVFDFWKEQIHDSFGLLFQFCDISLNVFWEEVKSTEFTVLCHSFQGFVEFFQPLLSALERVSNQLLLFVRDPALQFIDAMLLHLLQAGIAPCK